MLGGLRLLTGRRDGIDMPQTTFPSIEDVKLSFQNLYDCLGALAARKRRTLGLDSRAMDSAGRQLAQSLLVVSTNSTRDDRGRDVQTRKQHRSRSRHATEFLW